MSAWTTEKPKKEGWYWFRCAEMSPSIVQIFETADWEIMMVGPEVNCIEITTFVKARDEYDELEHQDCEWQPVEPAKD